MPSDTVRAGDRTSGKLIAFPSRFVARARAAEREFLPSALELIETPASRVGRAMMGVIVLLVVAAVAWACLSELDIIAVANGRLKPAGDVKMVQPLEIGVVKRIAVRDGEHVAKGDVLIELDPTTTAADVDRLARDLMQARLDDARLSAELADNAGVFAAPAEADPLLVEAERHQLATELAQHRAKLGAIVQQIIAKSAERQQALESIARLDATLPLIREKAELYRKVAENQYTSHVAVLEAERQFIEAQHDRNTASFQVRLDEAQIAALTEQNAQTREELRGQDMKDLAKARQTGSQLAQELIKAQQRTGLQTLRSPVDGTVEQISVHTVGGVVTPAQTLMVVVPDGTQLEIEATLPNREVGFVHAGQPVEIKVEAFNYTRYGLLHGVVRSVGRDTLRYSTGAELADKDPFAPKQTPARQEDSSERETSFMIRASVDRSEVETEMGKMELGPGMAVTVEIKTGERRVIEYVLSPIMRYRHDGLRER